MVVDLPIDPQLFASAPTNVVAGVATGHNSQTNDATTQTDGIVQSGSSEEYKYTCPLCGAKRSRRYTIKQHFPGCVRKHGNPENLEWTDHPSTKDYSPRKPSFWNKNREHWHHGWINAVLHNIADEEVQKRAQSSRLEEPSVVGQSETSSQHEQTDLYWQPVMRATDLTEDSHEAVVGSATGPYHLGQTVEIGGWNTPYAAPVARKVQDPFANPEADRSVSRISRDYVHLLTSSQGGQSS